MTRVSDLTLIAQKIGEQRSALLLGDEDLTLKDLARINDTTGFTFERVGGMGSTLVVSEYHLSTDELAHVYRRSDEFLG